jgi:hypothetical protein
MAALIPGVDYAANSVLIVNGAPSNSEAVRIEGQNMTNHFVSFALQEYQPSPDAIRKSRYRPATMHRSSGRRAAACSISP